MNSKIKSKIDGINWDFKGHDTQYMTHGIHKYPARMIPQIAISLINTFSKEGDTILDPFCGSGTVLTEAFLSRRNSKGNDLNPLALLISKVRTTPINTDRITKFINDTAKSSLKSTNEENPINFVGTNLTYWFKNYVIDDLTHLKNKIRSATLNKDEKDFLRVCFSATVRETSNVRQGEYKLYRIPPAKLEKYTPNVLATFLATSKKYINKMNEFMEYSKTNKLANQISITKSDSRFLPKGKYKNNSIDLIVTSPPYGDSRTTVAYGQFSRYSLVWLDLEKEEIYNLDKNLLGGRKTEAKEIIQSPTLIKVLKKINRRDPERARDTEWFMIDLYLSLKEMGRVLKKGGHACIVIGNRAVRRIRVPTSKIIEEIATNMPEGYKFIHEKTVGRNITSKNNPSASKFKLSDGSEEWIKTMSTEDIVILKKL